MKIAASSAEGERLDLIIEQTWMGIEAQMDRHPIDMGFVFLSPHFVSDAQSILDRIRKKTGTTTLLGCSGESVIGPSREYERTPSISLWMASLPEAKIEGFYLSPGDLKSANSRDDWYRLLHIADPSHTTVILLGDPFSTDVEKLLNGINEHIPGFPIVGGMASSGYGPGQNVLFQNDQLHRFGTVGLSIASPYRLESVVSQGCRPIGQPYIIGKGEQNIIQQLGVKSSIQAISEMIQTLPNSDKELIANGLFVGRVIDEYKDVFRRGDFLIRNVLGADEESGSIAVMDRVKIGTTIQFHVRDSETADEDMRSLLIPYSPHPPQGVLLFSCNGRGTRLFARPNHDVSVIRELLNSPPTAGFFCAGEFGPVGGKNFIHGHTASMLLFRNSE